ncbi:NAD(P)-dependent alcohol dehydrogenase [Jiangella mangrovi]|uniref:NADPH:quinone reductase-like Zn-dependent oxidoreductase n=1 Tax=Jiangella mangrovi TaxID=1524084 RepID=A0A7W9GQZ6_9ACTN|nr:NAD(P)-dependent alcohol dehydrogenase [Jiangella mangrovi]MBB5788229.1 NADPH:quinone reductase-like Zn-dependent oxidoreductase [Jiangella mangrovi]
MKAAVNDRYGPPDVVRVADVPRPEPKADQVLVRVHTAAVTSGDARLRAARFPAGFAPFARLAFGVVRPRRKVLGSAYSGVVEAVGSAVTRLRPGDRVCGMAGARMGAHAEYVAMPAEKVAVMPDGVSHDDAAGVLFGGTTALFFLRDKGHVAAGQSVLVNGASGAIGTSAVQLARHFGATVTGVTSGANAELVTRLGAAHVVDHTRHDVTRTAERYDLVLDTVGNLSIKVGRPLLTPSGRLLLAVGSFGDTLRARGNVVAGVAPERRADYEFLLGLVAAGELTVVVDQVYDLADAAEAHARVDTGHKVGNVLLHP